MMQSRILQSILLAASCSLFAPLAPAHVGEHADSGPLAQFAHLLTRADHWLVPPGPGVRPGRISAAEATSPVLT